MAVMAAAMRRKTFMDRGRYKLYPNLYVIIVGESGKIRKSVAMDMGIALLDDAVPDIKKVAGRVTPEGLVKMMNRIVAPATATEKVRYESHMFIHCDELATFFGYDKLTASRMSILLTELYSAKKEYEHITKSDAAITLHNLYPTLLAGTDPRNLKVLPSEAVGGLLGRTIFVSADKRKRKIAWPAPSQNGSSLYTDLKVDLARISALEGEFVPTDDARELYRKWYEEFVDIETTDPRINAFRERAHDTALKIAMLICASRTNNMIVTGEHIAGGIAIIEKQILELPKILSLAADTAYSQQRAKFIDILMRHKGGRATRSQMMRAMSISLDDMNSLITSLVEERTIKIGKAAGAVVVQLTADYIAGVE